MKAVSNNTRQNSAIAVLHLFEFDMYDFSGNFVETLRFTDHDIFVETETDVEYTPLAITFDKLREDGSMQSDSINISLDNVSGGISAEALSSEWRNNRAKIDRVIYTPSADTINGETYDYGYGDNLDVYPKLKLFTDTSVQIPRTIPFTINTDTTVASVDRYTLFEGIIDTFSATESSLSGTLTTEFTHWSKSFPERTYNQSDFTSVVNAITETVYWGRVKDV